MNLWESQSVFPSHFKVKKLTLTKQQTYGFRVIEKGGQEYNDIPNLNIFSL